MDDDVENILFEDEDGSGLGFAMLLLVAQRGPLPWFGNTVAFQVSNFSGVMKGSLFNGILRYPIVRQRCSNLAQQIANIYMKNNGECIPLLLLVSVQRCITKSALNCVCSSLTTCA